MARQKKEVYTQEEVELITRLLVVEAFTGVNSMLLNSGAQPSKEVGEIIMGVAGVVLRANGEVVKAIETLQLDDTRLAQLQVLANGALK